MARKRSKVGRKAGLPERLSVGAITRAFPMRSVRASLRECNRMTARARELSAEAVVYYVIALGLMRPLPAREVLKSLADGLQWAGADVPVGQIGRSALSEARIRVGTRPFKALRNRKVRPFANSRVRGAWYNGLRLLAYDSFLLRAADEKRNLEAFGRVESEGGRADRPAIRVTSLVELGTRASLDWSYGPCSQSQQEQALGLLDQLPNPALVLAPAGFASQRTWESTVGAGPELLWRVEDRSLPVDQRLEDGSFRSTFAGTPVRVVDYGPEDVDAPPRRLLTTLLDPLNAPALELAAVYHRRMDIDARRDGVRLHTLERESPLRSRTPCLVEQEIEGLMLAEYAVRKYLHRASKWTPAGPDQTAFIRDVRIVHDLSAHASDPGPVAVAGDS